MPKSPRTTVIQWIRDHAHRLTTLDVHAPQTDLLPLAALVGDSQVVALGTSARQAHELSALSHRVVRFLVEEMGFRSLALEGDDPEKLGLGAYISTPRTLSPSPPPLTHRNCGSYLREHFGAGYMSAGVMFHHGMAPCPIPAPPPEFADAVLGDAGLDAFFLDLHAEVPAPVRSWLDEPGRTRMIGPAYDAADNAAYHLAGGSLSAWFDVILHARSVTPIRPLSAVTS